MSKTAVNNATLFYPPGTKAAELRMMAAGISDAVHDTVEFKEEDGGEETRELAIPFMPGMDEVRVEEAQVNLIGVTRQLDLTGYAVTKSPSGNDAGLVLSLQKPARLRRITIEGLSEAMLKDFAVNKHLVVRPAQKQGGGFAFGPPIYAQPNLDPPGKMYDRVLAGLDVQRVTGGLSITFPNTAGSAWLIQMAQGSDPMKLASKTEELSAIDFDGTVSKVVVSSAPLDLSLVIAGDGAADIPLWSHPDYLWPEMGAQEVNFAPVAQNHLTGRMKQIGPGASAVTLPVPLRFTSAAGGAVEMRSRRITARYSLNPLKPDTSVELDQRGNWTTLGLTAPAGLRPSSGTARLTARLKGWELNGGSMLPPLGRPGSGLRVGGERRCAVALPFTPAGGAAAGSLLPLVSARLYLGAWEPSEAALEIHQDSSGSPGPLLTPPIVKQVEKGFEDWLEFELAAPQQVATGGPPLWLVLRSTRGELLWFGSGEGVSRVSNDSGRTWGVAEPLLAAEAAPLAQLFHASEDPLPPPVLRVQLGEAVLTENLLTSPVTRVPEAAPREYIKEEIALPEKALDALRDTGGGRAELRLFSRSVMKVVVENFVLFYSPSHEGVRVTERA